MPSISKPWAILLCKFSDKADEPQPVDYYADLFTQNGTGGICDYFRAVTCNTLDLSQSRVFGWFNAGHTSTEYSQLVSQQASGSRTAVIQWGKSAAQAAGVNLAGFSNVLVYFNVKPAVHDHGAAGIPGDVLILQNDPATCEFGFICHEMGHGLGLQHSWAANPDFVYGDGWDVMSWQTTQYTFNYGFRGTSGLATVAMNAHNLGRLNALPQQRVWTPPHANFSEQVVLDPLGQPAIGNHGFLNIKILPQSSSPARADGSVYSIECRKKAGWDQAIPRNAVLIHQLRTDGNSYIQPARWTDFVAGSRFNTPDPKVFVQVMAIDNALATATIRTWDIPENSLRREDSDSKVYLIKNGTKCWVTSPAVLTQLGFSFADVRVVPDGGLNTLPLGADIYLHGVLVTGVHPYPVKINLPATITVSATDSVSNAAVNGRVIVNNIDIGATNTPITYTFKSIRKRVGTAWEVFYPGVLVRAANYADTAVDCGFPDA